MSHRVLIADDEPSTAEIFALMFAFSGYDVERASDGEQALHLARARPPDALLLDVLMPRMDGREVVRQIRRDPALSDKVVILFSSVDEQEVDWQESGADLFLQKPVDVRELPSLVGSLISARREDKGTDSTLRP